MRIFYWCHTVSRQGFETGIQRVTRRLASALSTLGVEVVQVGSDDLLRVMEVIGSGFEQFEALLKDAAQESLLFVPDISLGLDAVRLGQAYGLRPVGLVHDLIPLKLHHDYDEASLELYRRYYESFAQTDATIATTQHVARALSDFLGNRGLRVPPIDIVSLPAQFSVLPRVTCPKRIRLPGEPLRIVALGSWEPRKNQLRLVRAVSLAQHTSQVPLDLTLVGRCGMFPDYDAQLERAISQSPHVTVAGTLPDARLAALLMQSDATVYSSFEEGFGLPIGESLWLGTPCLHHDGSPMTEVASGGGTLAVDMLDETAIADAISRCAAHPRLLETLGREACDRPLRSWDDFASDVMATARRVLRSR